jgi:hypothetical protein
MVADDSSVEPGQGATFLPGKVVVITGGNVGLGRHSAIELAKHGPAQLVDLSPELATSLSLWTDL